MRRSHAVRDIVEGQAVKAVIDRNYTLDQIPEARGMSRKTTNEGTLSWL